MDRLDVIAEALDASDGRYLEIGVRAGATFWNAPARAKIGVDPAFFGRKLNLIARFITPARAAARLTAGTFLFSEPSDDFFARRTSVLARMPPDCVLVDGLHTAEQTYRDVEHALEWLAPRGVIVMHDCNPVTRVAALPSREEAAAHPDYTGEWNGTAWKALIRLRTRHDLDVRVLDCDYGLGIVKRGTPATTLALSEHDIADLTYDDLCDARTELLNLVDP